MRVIDGIPTLSAVRGSNFCDIGFEVDRQNNRVVVVSAIDNLVNGTSGQAIQIMNLMCGFEETEWPGLHLDWSQWVFDNGYCLKIMHTSNMF